jgi:FkbM family methyltransferase
LVELSLGIYLVGSFGGHLLQASAMFRSLVKSAFAKAGFEVKWARNVKPGIDMNSGLASLRRVGIIPATVLDVGASDGQWSQRALQVFPNASYVLFEPQPVHAAALERFRSEHQTMARVVNKAVGRLSGSTYFEADRPLGGALAHAAGDNVIEVPMTSLDDMVAEFQLVPPYLIKLDTHGYEYSILEGASKTLRETNALIIEAYNHKGTSKN